MLVIDGAAGVSGDRLLAALVDAGLPVAWLSRLLARIPGVHVRLRPHRRRGGGTAVLMQWPAQPQGPRPAQAVVAQIARSWLPGSIKRTTLAILRRIIWAEARVHRCPPSRVWLRQLGNPDMLVALVGVGAALAYFKITQVVATPLLLGARHQGHDGRWRSVVGPAVRQLTMRWPVWVSRRPVEVTTPTGAAVVTALARRRLRAGTMELIMTGAGWSWRGDRRLGPVLVRMGRPGTSRRLVSERYLLDTP